METDDRFICDREQCGYTGNEQKSGGATAVDSALALFTCGPCAVLVIGSILAIGLALIHPSLGVLGFIIGGILALFTIIGSASRTPCPACKRGHLVDITSERGQALAKRSRYRS